MAAAGIIIMEVMYDAAVKTEQKEERKMQDAAQENPDRWKLDLLTKRETEVLMQVAKGMNNRETADYLNITEQTVKNHLSSVFRKLGVFDRTQAAIFAVKNRL